MTNRTDPGPELGPRFIFSLALRPVIDLCSQMMADLTDEQLSEFGVTAENLYNLKLAAVEILGLEGVDPDQLTDKRLWQCNACQLQTFVNPPSLCPRCGNEGFTLLN